ncbi:MAG: lipo-like protein [Rhodanobacteraceae bacterium]
MNPVSRLARWGGNGLARFLTHPVRRYQTFAVSDENTMRAVLRPADVLLVEGDARVSVAIKYLTQSTWSHACLYVGEALAAHPRWHGELVEAELADGVIASPLSKYRYYNTRICRPVGLTDADRARVIAHVIDALGHQYDLRNLIDLARYLIQTPPVPSRMRRKLLDFGSGDPTRGICSTIIAQGFQAVRYPILPQARSEDTDATLSLVPTAGYTYTPQHFSLFTPRDFDLSPYFTVVKPTIERGFDYQKFRWAALVDGAG